jgi:hypothetical protein
MNNSNGNIPPVNRSHYYVKIYVDDHLVNITNVICDSESRCNWESLATFLDQR